MEAPLNATTLKLDPAPFPVKSFACRHLRAQEAAPAQLAVPADPAQIPHHLFQPTAGSQAFGGEIDLRIAVDVTVQFLFFCDLPAGA